MLFRSTSLRDFLLLFFFLHMGIQLDFGYLHQQVGSAVLLSLFVLIGNPLIVMAIMASLAAMVVPTLNPDSIRFAGAGQSRNSYEISTRSTMEAIRRATVGGNGELGFWDDMDHDRMFWFQTDLALLYMAPSQIPSIVVAANTAGRYRSKGLMSWDPVKSLGWRGPYMGFRHVELIVLGHVNNPLPLERPPVGHYERWLLSRGNPEEVLALCTASDGTDTEGAAQTWHSVLPVAWHSSSWVADRTVDYIARRDRSRPFCAWVSFPDPHQPFDCPVPWSKLYDPKDVPLPKKIGRAHV